MYLGAKSDVKAPILTILPNKLSHGEKIGMFGYLFHYIPGKRNTSIVRLAEISVTLQSGLLTRFYLITV